MVGPKLSEAEKLKKKIANVKLHSLLEITKAINENYSTEKLFSIYVNILSKELNIGKVALFTNERGIGIVPSSMELLKIFLTFPLKETCFRTKKFPGLTSFQLPIRLLSLLISLFLFFIKPLP